MKKVNQEANVIVTFSEGWKERFTKAAYELWAECKEDDTQKVKTA